MSGVKGQKHNVIRGTSIPNTRENLFLHNIVKHKCWIWIGAKRNGYGRFRVDGKHVSAHRFSYEMYINKIPDGMSVLHECDNPPCVNPDHLFTGTYADNNKDRDKKGRFTVLRGSDNGKAKLTDAKVRSIKRLLSKGTKGVDIAKRFNISTHTISLIKNLKQWSHIV